MFAAIARAVTRRPWWVVTGWLLAAGVIVGLAPGIDTVTNANQAALRPAGAESVRADELAVRTGLDAGGSTAVVVVRRRDGGALTDADLAAAGRYGPPQIAPNRSVALIVVRLAGAAGSEEAHDAVRRLRTDIPSDAGITARVTGEAAIALDNEDALAGAERTVTVTTLVLIVLLLLVIFRSPLAAMLPLACIGMVYAVSSALVALLATATGVQVGQELPTMLTVVLFGIGTDYLLFLLFRYRERLRAGDAPADAVVGAVRRVGEAIFSAAFAVIAAFGALVLATLGFFTTLGPALAVGVGVMLLAALTLVPALLTLLGRRLFWPEVPTPADSPRSGFTRLGRLVARRPVVVIAAAVALLAALGAGVAWFQPDHDPVAQLPADTEAAAALADLRRGFPAGAVQPTRVYVTSDQPLAPAGIAAVAERLAAVEGVATPLPPRVAADGRTAAIGVVLEASPYSAAALDLVEGPLRAAARAAAPAGATVLVGGPSMTFAEIRAATGRDLAVILPVAGLLFVLILAALLRAALAPLYLVAMVVAGFAATLGAATWVFRDGLAFTIPIILYLFVTAIGTDYNILVTARLREEMRAGRSPREAAARAVAQAGPSVAAAALILAGTFGALLIAGVPFFAQIGFAVTLGIVLVAFVVSILLVPAVSALGGRAVWWPNRPPNRPVARR